MYSVDTIFVFKSIENILRIYPFYLYKHRNKECKKACSLIRKKNLLVQYKKEQQTFMKILLTVLEALFLILNFK